jgi:hypothetical protein
VIGAVQMLNKMRRGKVISFTTEDETVRRRRSSSARAR